MEKNFDANAFNFLPEVKHQKTNPFPDFLPLSYFDYTFTYPFLNTKQEVCVLMGFYEVDEQEKEKRVYKSSLFNISLNKFEFDGINTFASENIINGTDVPLENRYLATTFYNWNTGYGLLYSIDIYTGKLIWQTLQPRGLPIFNRLQYKDKIYCLMSSGPMIVYDAYTGKKLFEVETAHGGGSNIIAYNNTIYFVSADYQLTAIEPQTGEQLLKVKSSDYAPFHIFGTSIGVANGKIIVDNYKNVYCYPAIK